ncbi:unnamed protein product [Zymoseptoria tritici ST99CH_3D1]|nr:unnamed protein product [Zymoseptoria tritici ST99CH_3D1]
MKRFRPADPLHHYYARALDITEALHSSNAQSCPVRPYLKGEHYACKGAIGQDRTQRILHLLEDMHFHKSALINDPIIDTYAVASIYRISALITQATFCSKHKAEVHKQVTKTQLDRISSKALECALFQHPNRNAGEEIHDLQGVMRMLQADHPQTSSYGTAKRAHEKCEKEEEGDTVQPSTPKKPRLSSSGWVGYCAPSMNTSIGPPSNDPTWMNPSWLPMGDPFWQPSVDGSTAHSLQGTTPEDGNDVHQAGEGTTLGNHWWLTPLPSNTSEQPPLPQDGAQLSAAVAPGPASPSAERLSRLITVRAGGPASSMGNDLHAVDSLPGGGHVHGEGNVHQTSDAANLYDMIFGDVDFNAMDFDATNLDPTNLDATNFDYTSLTQRYPQSNDPSKQQLLPTDLARSSELPSAATSRADSSTSAPSSSQTSPATSRADSSTSAPSSSQTSPSAPSSRSTLSDEDDVLRELFPDV